MNIKYLLSAFFIASFFMTGCSTGRTFSKGTADGIDAPQNNRILNDGTVNENIHDFGTYNREMMGSDRDPFMGTTMRGNNLASSNNTTTIF